jgi:N-acetylglucosaminyl-diphospho-decaprenol L-rhamnosyltransferase
MQPVDVVVVSYNSREHLRACVAPLSRLPDVHVVVVDSASVDDSLESVADLGVATVALGKNRGFAHACNAGWRRGRAPFVLFLNPDAEIDSRSLEHLVRTATSAATTGVVAPRVVNADGALDFSQRRFPRLRSTYAQALFLHRLFPRAAWTDELVRDPGAYERPGSPEWVSGACFLVPRSVLEHLGGLDDGFFLYCEDLDLCRRVRDHGLEVRFDPRATAVHEGGASEPRASLLPVLAASRIRYARKHASPHTAALERIGIALGALTHALVSRGGRAVRRGHLHALRLAVVGPGGRHIPPERPVDADT